MCTPRLGLKTVLLKRPGRELENLTPDYLERLLFDDIPHLPVIQKEHDYFASALQNRGVEVLYLEKLMVEVLALPAFVTRSSPPFYRNRKRTTTDRMSCYSIIYSTSTMSGLSRRSWRYSKIRNQTRNPSSSA